ncbi:MAG TPA: hypothetical protein VFU81_02385 [Thermomicrobiales bacterium]|nr:hypothetical protein [Thermomicrobiales bacterium]
MTAEWQGDLGLFGQIVDRQIAMVEAHRLLLMEWADAPKGVIAARRHPDPHESRGALAPG